MYRHVAHTDLLYDMWLTPTSCTTCNSHWPLADMWLTLAPCRHVAHTDPLPTCGSHWPLARCELNRSRQRELYAVCPASRLPATSNAWWYQQWGLWEQPTVLYACISIIIKQKTKEHFHKGLLCTQVRWWMHLVMHSFMHICAGTWNTSMCSRCVGAVFVKFSSPAKSMPATPRDRKWTHRSSTSADQPVKHETTATYNHS